MVKLNMKTISNFYNEKGNVASKVRAGLKEQVERKVMEVIPGIETSEKGMRIPLCVNERGETVYAFVAVSISVNTEVKARASKAKAEPVAIEVPELF